MPVRVMSSKLLLGELTDIAAYPHDSERKGFSTYVCLHEGVRDGVGESLRHFGSGPKPLSFTLLGDNINSIISA